MTAFESPSRVILCWHSMVIASIRLHWVANASLLKMFQSSRTTHANYHEMKILCRINAFGLSRDVYDGDSCVFICVCFFGLVGSV